MALPPAGPLPPAETDLANRQPAWEALADLFLDTDTSLSRAWRVGQLAQAPYSIEQLEWMLVHEVYPVCKYNLWSVAGEWAGFDPDWLRTRILKRLNSRWRLPPAFNLGRYTVHASLEWRATRQAIQQARKAAPVAPMRSA